LAARQTALRRKDGFIPGRILRESAEQENFGPAWAEVIAKQVTASEGCPSLPNLSPPPDRAPSV